MPKTVASGGCRVMTYLEWLDNAVAAQLKRDRIGRPVFLRASLQITADHGLLLPILAAAMEAASRWMRSPVRRVYAQGGSRQGFASVLVEFGDGQTALLSTELSHGGEAFVELLLLGQHGSFRFQDQPEPIQLRDAAPVSSRHWTAALEQSIAAGKPVAVSRE